MTRAREESTGAAGADRGPEGRSGRETRRRSAGEPARGGRAAADPAKVSAPDPRRARRARAAGIEPGPAAVPGHGAAQGGEPGSLAPRPHDAAPGRTQAVPVDVTADGLPDWLEPVSRSTRTIAPEQLSRYLPPASGGRQAAVLVLFGEGARGPELLLMERAGTLRSHAGQPSFPGGALDPEDGDPATLGPLRAALREAEEETGLDPGGVQVFGVLPRLYIPVSGFVVTPVLGWWRTPSPVGAVDPGETARVFTVPVAGSHGPGQPRHRGPSQRLPGARVPGGVGPRLGLHGRGDRPDPALRGVGAAVGQEEAGPTRRACMTGWQDR